MIGAMMITSAIIAACLWVLSCTYGVPLIYAMLWASVALLLSSYWAFKSRKKACEESPAFGFKSDVEEDEGTETDECDAKDDPVPSMYKDESGNEPPPEEVVPGTMCVHEAGPIKIIASRKTECSFDVFLEISLPDGVSVQPCYGGAGLYIPVAKWDNGVGEVYGMNKLPKQIAMIMGGDGFMVQLGVLHESESVVHLQKDRGSPDVKTMIHERRATTAQLYRSWLSYINGLSSIVISDALSDEAGTSFYSNPKVFLSYMTSTSLPDISDRVPIIYRKDAKPPKLPVNIVSLGYLIHELFMDCYNEHVATASKLDTLFTEGLAKND